MSAAAFTPFPQRQSYHERTDLGAPLPYAQLPFMVVRKGKDISNWHVPRCAYDRDAFDVGREYAAHLAAFFRDCPRWVGGNMLINVAENMNLRNHGDFKYPVSEGFFSHIEFMLQRYAQTRDLFADVDGQVQKERAELARAGLADFRGATL